MNQKRDFEIKKLLVAGSTYRNIANIYNLSRQRIQQICKPCRNIINKMKLRSLCVCEFCGLPTQHGHVHHINKCGHPLNTKDILSNYLYLCRSCHRLEHLRNPLLFNYKEKFVQQVKCFSCGAIIVLQGSQGQARYKRNKNIFCNKVCQGRFLGKNYGRGKIQNSIT